MEFNATTTDAVSKLKFYVGNNSTCIVIDKVEMSEGNFQLEAQITTTGSTTVCEGSSVVLNASTGTDYTYQWKRGDAVIDGATAASFTATQSGIYSVTVTANGQSVTSDAVEVKVNPTPPATITAAGSTTIVEGNRVVLNANAGTGLSYKWFNGSEQVGTDASYTAATSGSYSVEVTNGAGCKAASTPTAVVVNRNQPSVITINAPVTNENIVGDVITFDVSVDDPDGTITKVEYYLDGQLVGSSTSSPYIFEYKNASPGSHEVLVKATDSNGGVTTSSPVSLNVSVATGVFSGGYKVFTGIVPNPSSESFKITSNMAIRHLRITNIYGAEVEALNDIPSDQTSSIGQDLKGGTYLMTIEYVSGSIEVSKLVKLQ